MIEPTANGDRIHAEPGSVPISAAEVSIPSFAIRFTDIRLEIEGCNCRLSIIDAAERLTLIDASPFLAADYSWRVFDTSARQRQFSVILIGSLPLW
jgi:hypothetical protein